MLMVQLHLTIHLDVDGQVTFNDTTDASSTTNGSVQIDGGVGIVKKLFVGDDTKIENTTESTSKDSNGSLIVDGGVGIEKIFNIGGSGVIAGRLDVNNTEESTSHIFWCCCCRWWSWSCKKY